MKAVLALLCCLALLAGPAVALAGWATGMAAGCCSAGSPPCGHEADGGGHHDQDESAPAAGCAAFCTATCCVAVLSVEFTLGGPTLADFVWRDFFATGARRTDRPPLPPPRAWGFV